MPLGDSITDGFNIPGGYRVRLWELITQAGKSVDFVGSANSGPNSLGDKDHEGHSGWLIDDIDQAVVGWLNSYQPSVILLMIGTNDMVIGHEWPDAPKRLGNLVDKIAETSPNSSLLLASIVTNPDPAVRDRIVFLNDAIPGIVTAKAAEGYSIYYIDVFSALSLADIGDGVHPNAGGYDKMADAWWSVLEPLLP